MTFNFPTGPAEDQIFTPPGGPTYIYKAPKWLVVGGPDFPEAPNDNKQYARKNLAWAEVAIPATAWADIPGKPATFPPTLPIAESSVTNLVTDLAALASRATALEAKDTTHDTAISDATSKNAAQDTRLNNLESDTTSWTELTGKPATFPPTLPIAETDVTSLVADLAAKVSDSGDTMTGKLTFKASNATSAPINMPQGVGPSGPNDGDIWMNGTTLTVRGSSISYATAYLNGSSTFTGTKTFSVPPVMTTPTTALASLNLPHGVAPTAPVNGDMWTTSAGLFVQINGVTVGPLAAAAGAIVSDTPPATAFNGQLWFESDSGRTYIRYDDGNSAQWVMIGPTGLPVQPFLFDTNGDVVCKFGASIVIRIKPTGLFMTKDDIEIFSVSV